jgi:hypothetical protein
MPSSYPELAINYWAIEWQFVAARGISAVAGAGAEISNIGSPESEVGGRNIGSISPDSALVLLQ